MKVPRQFGSLKRWLHKSACKERQSDGTRSHTQVWQKGGNAIQCGRCGKTKQNKDENCPAKKSK